MTTNVRFNSPMEELYASLKARKRPEDVAEIAERALGSMLSDEERAVLERASKGSLRKGMYGWSAMAESFAAPTGMGEQVKVATQIFEEESEGDIGADPARVRALIGKLNSIIGRNAGDKSFKDDRLSAPERKELGIDISRRQYNKRFRLLARMEEKLVSLADQVERYELNTIAKSALASQIAEEDFMRSATSAAFIAYLTARANLRSEFTIEGQQRAFDKVAAMLLEKCKTDADASWLAIAHVFPRGDVFERLAPHDVGVLLGRWDRILGRAAAVLKASWGKLSNGQLDRRSMIVERGMDSSGWNTAAGAWNKARDHWMSLVYALGLEQILDARCPGKVMRLMAADVAYWHRSSGGGVDPNSEVWAKLPLPWQVMDGEAQCGRAEVEAICAETGVDPEKTGWTAPRERTKAAEFKPTPEMVHGVTVESPGLAALLKKQGYFQGPAKAAKRTRTP